MNFFEMTWGTLVNSGVIVVATLLGVAVSGKLHERITKVVMQGIGLVTLFIGIANAFDLTRVEGRLPGILLGLLAIVMGGALGEWWRISDHLHNLGENLKKRFKGSGRFTEGFVAATLLFGIGPMAILGSVQNGLTGNADILMLKTTLDAFTSIAFATVYGIGVAASALVLLLYQGGMSLAAGALTAFIPDPATSPDVLLINGVGGLLIVALGINVLEIKHIRIASFLPALPLVVVLYHLTNVF